MRCPTNSPSEALLRKNNLRLVALQAVQALIEVSFLPAPDGGLRRMRAPHDLARAVTIRRLQNDLRPPDELARRVPVGDQGLEALIDRVADRAAARAADRADSWHDSSKLQRMRLSELFRQYGLL